VKTAVETKIANLKSVKDGTDAEVIKKASEELSAEMSKIGEAMQKAAPDAGAGAAPDSANSAGQEAKDADFKETPPEGEAK